MNPLAILSLISQLYEQLSAANERIQELEAQLNPVEADEPSKTVREG